MNKQEIIDRISEIVNFCINDANTYLYAKCVPTIKEDNEKIPIGGGNFTVLLSTLATLEFLGTINAIIQSDSDGFWSEEEIRKLKATKEELKEKYKDDILLKNFVLRPFSLFPETGTLKKGSSRCIETFLKETKQLTGLSDNGIETLKVVRNKLAHEFTPKIVPAAGIGFVPNTDFVNLILHYEKRDVFTTLQNSIGIDSNALNRKMRKLLKYIIQKLESLSEDSEKIKVINKYIENAS